MGDVLDLLRSRSDERLADWLKYLEAADGPGPGIEDALPAPDDLPGVLLDLAVPHEDINALVALRRTVTEDPDLRWLLERGLRALVSDMGTVDTGPQPQTLPEELGAVGRYLHVFGYVAAVPYVRAYHRERGIPDDVSRHTLADLGRNVAVHRKRHGTGGLNAPHWPKLHFHGELYQLGRLQFERARLGDRTGRAVAAAGLPLGPGDPVLEIHIPDFRGPMTPSACDASVARAREFFARHFPEETYTVAACGSWLLDPQLAEYLPDGSNIIRFQRRFRPAFQPDEELDDTAVAFVFGDTRVPVADLPRRTRVERAIGDHLRAGRHWHGGRGWFAL